jgi:hypothetical protein
MPTEIQPTISEQPNTTIAQQDTQQPAPAEYLVPMLDRPFTEAERTALRRFIALLPVSTQLDRKGLTVLRGFVAPFYVCGQPETIVTEEAIQHRVNEQAERIKCQFSLADVHQVVERIFATTNTLIIGQLQLERDAATNSLVLRLNADNYNALLNFIVMLAGEDLI